MVAEVLVEIVFQSVDKTFDYIIPPKYKDNIQVGMRVLVDFNNRELEGFVMNIKDQSNIKDLKPIKELVDNKVILNEELMQLGYELQKLTLSPLITCFQAMLPKALKVSANTKINKKMVSYIKLINNEDNIYNESQSKIINLLKNQEQILKPELNKISVSSVKTLLKNNIIEEIIVEEYRDTFIKEDYPHYQLTKEQNKIVTKFNETNNQRPFLLYGVTGSGKTEIYMELIDGVIKQNKTAIVLVPEISLTPQIIKRFSSRFERLAVLHSRLSDGEKYDEWRKIKNNEVDIVIGARSAIFAPLSNLGLIVIDEEQTTTYSQDSMPRYHVLDIALLRMKYHNAKLLLGSATPSLESMARAQVGVYNLLSLNERVNNRNLPKVDIVDLASNYKRPSFYFSNELFDGINKRLNNQEQVMLLLNRRGYATTISCSSCGYISKCPHCDIALTYHQSSNMLRCHYCGYATKHQDVCPDCKNKAMKRLGIGTEKLEMEVEKLFPNAKVLRMDYDTTTKKGAYKKIIDSFANNEYDILIGTQMIAKGLDFPNVTLVGVINADNSLNVPDFRSSEFTYQLLEQVSGRSGRGKLPGSVIIQTFNPDHYAINLVKSGNYLSFYEEEMKIRQTLKYPPYYYVTLLTISSNDYELASKTSIKISGVLKDNLKRQMILGPSVANLFKVNNVYHFQIIIKYKNIDNQKEVINNVIKYYHTNKVKVAVTFNPTRIS